MHYKTSLAWPAFMISICTIENTNAAAKWSGDVGQFILCNTVNAANTLNFPPDDFSRYVDCQDFVTQLSSQTNWLNKGYLQNAKSCSINLYTERTNTVGPGSGYPGNSGFCANALGPALTITIPPYQTSGSVISVTGAVAWVTACQNQIFQGGIGHVYMKIPEGGCQYYPPSPTGSLTGAVLQKHSTFDPLPLVPFGP